MADPALFPTYRSMPVIPSRRQENLDRFIPNRSAVDFGYAHYMLTEGRNLNKNQTEVLSLSKEAYLKALAEVMGMNRTRILAFKDKPSPPKELITRNVYDLIDEIKATHRPQHIPQTPESKLDLPAIIDDDGLNLMDWGSNGILAIALNDTIHLWNDSNKSASELVTVDDRSAPITSVSWKDYGAYIAVGLNNSDVQLWDSSTNQLVRTFGGGHQSRVGSLSWAGPVLTTGGLDGMIINNDMRVKSHIVGSFRGHRKEVCGLKWSTSGRHLASGGKDNLVNIWDMLMASKHSCSERLHKFQGHNDAVRALAWCPFQYNFLASGGGENDCNIKFWETSTGQCLNSVNTDSQVCALLWNKKEHELLSSHGKQNQLTLWRYPSMVKIIELTGHKSRVLFMDQSPDGSRVATAAGDETLQIWNAFGRTKAKKIAPKKNPLPFSHITIH